MVAFVIGIIMIVLGYAMEQYDTITAVNASYKFECAPSIMEYNMLSESRKEEIRNQIIRCKQQGIPLTQNQCFIYYHYIVDRDENGNAINQY